MVRHGDEGVESWWRRSVPGSNPKRVKVWDKEEVSWW